MPAATVLTLVFAAAAAAADSGPPATTAEPPTKPHPQPPPVPRVAVVGGGVGGTLFASFLRSEFEAIGIAPEIAIYEQSERIGGRAMHTADAHPSGSADVAELGASMAIEQNRYVRELAERAGLQRQHATERPGRGSGKMAILAEPGQGFAWAESDSDVWTLGSLLWRYGALNFFRLRSHGASLIAAFERVYAAQDDGRAFRDPTSLLSVAGMDTLCALPPPRSALCPAAD